ncbi:SWIRM-domain-containing protein [Metschnikowia bicuspidata var. bicuspidata NRRL YB-4993]|uniref:SWIRM-domain-containing protein n=1 Tax=Metschnikowia bicuspidata var. bicuspidata NRRL YB-4993 TaxID=869754 RepID=A0A1A0HCL2_9ASCO|nr:SWIRM-domain-containing protein [Metschnikowia bicuspidata var. bicuspidata NRRL YB-4993]OBA21721.1 SWIRM-domain-containing protein [Metschnikowia bicuspidata var. bicuspidata NRRL YB-4993]
MTLLYQPISRTFGQRDGCLTPVNNQDDKRSSLKSIQNSAISNTLSSDFSSTHKIISPPLSPYQRESSSHDANDDIDAASDTEHYLASNNPFKIENFKSYSMTVDPWTKLDSRYKQRQLDFLSQYSFEAPRVVYLHVLRLSERRVERRKRVAQPTSSDSESDSIGVRTRKHAKESHAEVLTKEVDADVHSSPPQKKRKVRKEASYAGSPLAAQQAALIDESIPDYSPDAHATLPKGNTRALKIEWKGQPMDLRNDPNLDKLHPAEVVLASTLRLRCNVFLDSKRRFFYEKVNRLRNNMPFRRTDAQKACRIDVNKASRLFAAFEKAGWLDDKHFEKHL